MKRAKPIKQVCPEEENIQLLVYMLNEILSRLEGNRISALDLYLFTRLWVSPHTGFSVYLSE